MGSYVALEWHKYYSHHQNNHLIGFLVNNKRLVNGKRHLPFFWWPFQITIKIKAMLLLLAAYRSNIYLDLVHLYMKPLHLVSASLIHSNSTATFTFSDFMLRSFPRKMDSGWSFPRKMMVLIWVFLVMFKMITFFTSFMFPFPEQHSSCRYTIPIDTLVFDFDMPQVVLGGCGHVGKRRVS